MSQSKRYGRVGVLVFMAVAMVGTTGCLSQLPAMLGAKGPPKLPSTPRSTLATQNTTTRPTPRGKEKVPVPVLRPSREREVPSVAEDGQVFESHTRGAADTLAQRFDQANLVAAIPRGARFPADGLRTTECVSDGFVDCWGR